MMLDVKIRMFDDAPRTLVNGMRLHLYCGSAEVLCKAILLNKEKLDRGEEGYAQLRLEEELLLKMMFYITLLFSCGKHRRGY